MGLASLAFVPSSPAEFAAWSFSNQASHRDIARVIFQNQTVGVAISSLVYTSPTGALAIVLAAPAAFRPNGAFTISGITGGTGGGNYEGLNGTWTAVNVSGTDLSAVVTADLGNINTITGTPVVTGLGTSIVDYVLDPFDPENMGNWPWQHQDMHNAAWAAVGGSGYDLTGIDWDDPETMEMWISVHADEHNRLSAFLGLA